MNEIIQSLHLAVKIAKEDEHNLKHGDTLITSVLRRVARQEYQKIKHFSKDEIFEICERLLKSGDWQDRGIAFQWAFRIGKDYESHDFDRFERWLANYVDGWGSCDDFCTHAFGHLIFEYPEHIPIIKMWTSSENRWFRRSAAVVLIYGIRRGSNFESSFEIADLLLMDADDLVQKGYGWMLKEISNKDPNLVFNFVMQRKDRMPRTALRYAIEKLEPNLRKQAMEK